MLEKMFGITVLLLIIMLILFGGWTAVSSARSNGEIDYCFVEMWSPPQMSPQYQLWGHRPWRTDRNIGVYLTIEEAKSKADILGCKLNSK